MHMCTWEDKDQKKSEFSSICLPVPSIPLLDHLVVSLSPLNSHDHDSDVDVDVDVDVDLPSSPSLTT